MLVAGDPERAAREMRLKGGIPMPDSLIARCSPIQKQLLGVVDDALSYYLPRDEDVPLKALLAETGK